MKLSNVRRMRGAFLIVLCLWATPGLLAHHGGAGTSGGGVLTRTGNVLPVGESSFSLRVDFTHFETLSKADIRDRTYKVGSDDHPAFMATASSMLETVEFAHGMTEDFQLGFSFGFYRGLGLREGHLHGDGSYGYHDFGNVSGLSNQWINAAWQVAKGEDGRCTLLGGIKLPFGEESAMDQSGTKNTPLETSLQPSSGAFELSLGVGYTRQFDSALSMDASVQYHRRTRTGGFKVGDLGAVGVAFAYGFGDAATPSQGLSLIGEVNLRYLDHNEEAHEEVLNSGGMTIFAAPGLRYGFGTNVTLTGGVQIPVVQDLNDIQQKTTMQLSFSLAVTF